MKNTPYGWRLAVNAANGWMHKALTAMEERMAEIWNSPDRFEHTKEMSELCNTYAAIKAAYETMKPQA